MDAFKGKGGKLCLWETRKGLLSQSFFPRISIFFKKLFILEREKHPSVVTPLVHAFIGCCFLCVPGGDEPTALAMGSTL